MLTHFLSLDVEDWFHILDYEAPPEMRNWEALESRVESTTCMVLDLFDRAQVKCTCFVLGWIAERYPHLIQEIAVRGHEIATHGHRHLLVYEHSPEEFERDLLESVEAIENACGVRPVGFRAPGFSIKNGTLWALDVLAKNGFRYDASLFTAVRGHGGIRLNLRRPGCYALPVVICWPNSRPLLITFWVRCRFLLRVEGIFAFSRYNGSNTVFAAEPSRAVRLPSIVTPVISIRGSRVCPDYPGRGILNAM